MRLLHVFTGHTAEVVCVAFSPTGEQVATGGMDNEARVWDVRRGVCVHVLAGHAGELIALDWAANGASLLTGSFDMTVNVWNVLSGK